MQPANPHFGHLYKGYVDKFNKGEGDAGFNEAGAFLHGIYFAQFRTPGNRQPHGKILDLINRNHKNFVDFKQAFKEEAMKLQGSNWIYLSKSGTIKTIRNHAKRTDIALLVVTLEAAIVETVGVTKPPNGNTAELFRMLY